MRRHVGSKRQLETHPYRSSKSSRTEPGPLVVPRSLRGHYLDFREGLFKEVGKGAAARRNYELGLWTKLVRAAHQAHLLCTCTHWGAPELRKRNIGRYLGGAHEAP